jgi:tetratricopeptide (TPR) repeat protein
MSPFAKRLATAVLAACLSLQAIAAPQSDEFARAVADGEKAMAQGRSQDAIPFFEKAVQLDPRSAKAHVGLANALMGSVATGIVTDADIQTLQRAQKEEQIALELAPNSAEALAGLGELQFRIGLGTGSVVFKQSTGLAEAKQTLVRALAADPNNYHANYQLARIESTEVFWIVMQGRYSAGLKPGVKQDLPPAVKEALRRQCAPLFQKAIEHADKAISARENAYDAMSQLSSLYFMRSVIDESAEETQADLKLQQDWQTKSQIAHARFQRASSEPAEQAVELHNFQEAMAEGRRAVAAYHYESAVRAFEKAVQFDDKSADAHVELANALIRTSSGDNSIYLFDPERLQRAIQEDRKALDLAPNNAEAMAGMAAATYAINSHSYFNSKVDPFAEARDWARKALAADPKNYHANYLMAEFAARQAGVATFEVESEAYKNKTVRDNKVPPELMEPVRQKYGALVDEGFACINAALAVQPGSYMAMYQLSALYGVRSEFGGDSSKADRQLSLEWQSKAVRLAAKDDPDAQFLLTMQSVGSIVGAIGRLPPPPPPRPARPTEPPKQ